MTPTKTKRARTCECGNNATIMHGGYWICRRCYSIESERRQHDIVGRKPARDADSAPADYRLFSQAHNAFFARRGLRVNHMGQLRRIEEEA